MEQEEAYQEIHPSIFKLGLQTIDIVTYAG